MNPLVSVLLLMTLGGSAAGSLPAPSSVAGPGPAGRADGAAAPPASSPHSVPPGSGSAILPADAERGGAAADTLPALVGYLWVTRSTLLDSAAIERMVARAGAARVRGLLVQVVGRGDAYYRSDLLPRAEALRGIGFDPLALALQRTHAAGLELHAWMNCALVWSAPRPPQDPRHVLNRHPEWAVRLPDGRSMTRMSLAERRRLGVEGVYLSPARPAVRAWIASIAQEIAARYPVDGIHLDYIREPGTFVGLDADARARFALEHGADPARFHLEAPARRAALDSAWTAFQRAQVTGIVREVRDSLARVRPGLELSAAVLADTVSAEQHHAQDWRAWVRMGLIDRAFVMCYAPEVQTVLGQMLAYASGLGTGRVVPGIAVFNSSAPDAAAKIKGALALGYRTLALYSYDSLDERPGYWDALAGFLGLPLAAPAPAGER